MASPLRWTRIDSPIGPLGLAATERGLAALELRDDESIPARWEARFQRPVVRDDAALAAYADALMRYFRGETKHPDLPVDLLVGTPFQRKVWHALTTIPSGETRSYKWLAQQVGSERGYRAVGLANHDNPVPIVIPCHRVVNTNGRLGGYGGGLDMKRALLRLEGGLPAIR